MEKNWTTGSVLQSIWRFSLPYLLSYFLQTLYGMADLLIIGRFGTVADTTAVPKRPIISKSAIPYSVCKK